MEKKNFIILYVDDEVNNLISFRATFRREYKILTAQDGFEGLRILGEQEVHLVISDQRMPGMTGVEFLEKVNREYPGTIRMIITGFSDIDAVIGSINKGGVYRYIAKPWDEREMRMTIENARQLFGLQEENIISQFETLKSQVNPHFLFNSLNVLSSLIFIDQDKAAKFVRQLSKVYRYVLDHKDMDTIVLREELPFIESYIFLLKTRFDQNLQVKIEIPEEKMDHKVAPMVIQLLVENAIKHNVISRLKPLSVSITATSEDDYLTVSNNLQLKSSTERSSRIGLSNIRKRYDYLSGKKVDIIHDENHFTVKIPLLN
ncbi:MAG: histidine kinase [Bacteroidales bacterium]|nr:histidine kinase [Bacteroidales bacterium]